MNTADLTEQPPTRFTWVMACGTEYRLEVRRPAHGRIWVDVKEFQPELGWWKSILSESIAAGDENGDLDALKHAFRVPRGAMNRWLWSWRELRECAANEQGGKRGYYTRLANEALATALECAAKWKLCKSLWRGLTKL